MSHQGYLISSRYVAVNGSVLQCVAVCCGSVLQRVAVCCGSVLLQCVVAYYVVSTTPSSSRALSSFALRRSHQTTEMYDMISD